MLSKPAVYSRLRDGFIGVRFDWEQGNHYKDRIGFILGTGDQLLLTPRGKVIPPDEGKDGKPAKVYGRHGQETTAEVLDRVMAQHPADAEPPVLRMEWFLWPSKPARRPGGQYPVPSQAAAQYARLPIATVDGRFLMHWRIRIFCAGTCGSSFGCAGPRRAQAASPSPA